MPQDGTKGKKTRQSKRTLASAKDLAKNLDGDPLHFDYMQDRLEKLVGDWNNSIFGQQPPKLYRLGYSFYPNQQLIDPNAAHAFDDDDEGGRQLATRELERLRKNRHNLARLGVDPLELARQTAARATKKRSVPYRDDDGDEEDGHNLTLTDVPALSSAAKTPKKRRISIQGPPPDEGIFRVDGKVACRRRWTNEEKSAVIEGTKMFGIGKWAETKSHFAEILRNRTSVQIKDVWRTMTKKGEIDADLLAELEATRVQVVRAPRKKKDKGSESDEDDEEIEDPDQGEEAGTKEV